MRGNRNDKLNPSQEKYQGLVTQLNPGPRLGSDLITAFLGGGLVCVIGQFFTDLYSVILHLSSEQAGSPAVATVIFIAAVLTGFGIFDNLAAVLGAGITVPVTGFANSVASAALEFRREGFVQGIGSKMFILAGSVIVYGVVTAFGVGLIYSLYKALR